jgi:two-component system response regulator HydG
LVGDSDALRELKRCIAQVAPTVATVLIHGESGTGKELVARLIHSGSPRAQKPFVTINCAAVPENLIESELFGHEKGAFTGAASAKAGLFEIAHGGTLLLDEVGDMPLVLQAKLLRALQEGEVRRIGATSPKRVDVRVIAASHRNLRELARQGLFREDLLFRLEVIPLRVAPLRERSVDIPELAHYFLKVAQARHQKAALRLSAEVLEKLSIHSWPGNIRELSNVIERAVIFAQGSEVELKDLPPHLTGEAAVAKSSESSVIPVRLGTPLRDVEELLIRKTLEATDGDKTMTAKLLGINPRTIYRKLEQDRGQDPEAN